MIKYHQMKTLKKSMQSAKFIERLKKIQASQPTEEYLFPGWKNFENIRYIPPKKEKNKNDK